MKGISRRMEARSSCNRAYGFEQRIWWKRFKCDAQIWGKPTERVARPLASNWRLLKMVISSAVFVNRKAHDVTKYRLNNWSEPQVRKWIYLTFSKTKSWFLWELVLKVIIHHNIKQQYWDFALGQTGWPQNSEFSVEFEIFSVHRIFPNGEKYWGTYPWYLFSSLAPMKLASVSHSQR
jgi:hypothetical protein